MFLFQLLYTFSFSVGVWGLPYPGDAAPLNELVEYYHHLCYTSLQICGFLWYAHGVYCSWSMLKRLKRRLNLRRRKTKRHYQLLYKL